MEPITLVVGCGIVAGIAGVRAARLSALRREQQRQAAQHQFLRSGAASARREIRDRTRATINEMVRVSQRRQQ
jgi:hypothetical protein